MSARILGVPAGRGRGRFSCGVLSREPGLCGVLPLGAQDGPALTFCSAGMWPRAGEGRGSHAGRPHRCPGLSQTVLVTALLPSLWEDSLMT